ncbi:MAG: helix-turn-helix domain-containing protein [Leptospiraceae bacterium]|nr:helix-turn-helix domain-containing protein [Leptospiraceae bacterium]
MSETNRQYIKFMSDIIDSGLWGKLSPAAKTLYPVLLKFSDQNFKQVWPSTETLLKLTGFKTKKSIALGKKELIKEGLLQYKPGSGRTNSTYYFSFNYERSKITPQWDKAVSLKEGCGYPSGADFRKTEDVAAVSPNNLNITINNTQSNKQDTETFTIARLIDLYGVECVDSALQIAQLKGLEGNMSYIQGICKNVTREKSGNKPIFGQDIDNAQHVIDSWKDFLEWSRSHLTRSSVETLETISVEVDGRSIFIKQKLGEFLKQIILRYFQEQISPSIVVVFSEISVNSFMDSKHSHKF